MRHYVLLGTLVSSLTMGQTIDLNGRIIDNDSQPIENALVRLMNMNIQDTTDAEGNFHLTGHQTAIAPSYTTNGYSIHLSHGELTVTHGLPIASAQVYIYSLNGKLLLSTPPIQKSCRSCRFAFGRPCFSSGVYIIRLAVNSSVFHYKITGAAAMRRTMPVNITGVWTKPEPAASGPIKDTLIARKSGFIHKRLQLTSFADSLADITLGRQFFIIDSNLVDAEYSAQLGMVVAACSSSNHVVLSHPELEDNTVLSLMKKPKCVSVSLDGNYAAIGHDSLIVYIDLKNEAIINECFFPCDIYDIVMGKNGYAYAFPISCSGVISMDCNSGKWKKGGHQNSAMKAKMHPSGKCLYGATVGISPGDFYRYIINSDTISDWYDSPYHGEYDLGGNLWISEDGTRIFSSSGTSCTSDTVRDQDMLYSGRLSTTIGWLCHSSKANLLAALPNGSNIAFFHPVYLTDLGMFRLDSLMHQEGWTSPWGKFVFFGKDGTTCTVLVTGSGPLFSTYTLNEDQYPNNK